MNLHRSRVFKPDSVWRVFLPTKNGLGCGDVTRTHLINRRDEEAKDAESFIVWTWGMRRQRREGRTPQPLGWECPRSLVQRPLRQSLSSFSRLRSAIHAHHCFLNGTVGMRSCASDFKVGGGWCGATARNRLAASQSPTASARYIRTRRSASLPVHLGMKSERPEECMTTQGK